MLPVREAGTVAVNLDGIEPRFLVVTAVARLSI